MRATRIARFVRRDSHSRDSYQGMASAVPLVERTNCGFSRCGPMEFSMSMNSKKSMAWTMVLILFGLIALFGGDKSLVVLIPAAMMVWYRVGPTLRRGRN